MNVYSSGLGQFRQSLRDAIIVPSIDRWADVGEQASYGRRLGRPLVTTSWDDGHVLDHKLAVMLERHGVAGTFYVAPRNVELPEADRLGDRGIRYVAEAFEIGGHTRTHLRLPTLSALAARAEIADGRKHLEDVLGAPVSSFCYPGGAYTPEHVDMLLQEGFVAARTCERFDIAPDAPLEMSTGVNAYRHLVDGARLLQLANRDLRKTLRLFANWDDIAILLFDVVHAAGGVFHLWGHSWEIEANNDWKRLDRVLAHISGHPDVSYVNNTAVAVAISNLAVSAQQ